jgi:hypothetical protein
MIGLTTSPAQTRRMIEWIWLAQDIDNTIAEVRPRMSPREFDWRALGLTREPSWNAIRAAMLRYAIDQQLYQQQDRGGGNDRGFRDRAAA